MPPFIFGVKEYSVSGDTLYPPILIARVSDKDALSNHLVSHGDTECTPLHTNVNELQ